MPIPFFITTPIYYVNAKPHIGHAYTTIAADVTSRFNAMRNYETFFLTGTDEHGDKIVDAAKKETSTPKVYADKISGLFRDLWSELNIKYDYFIRTTDAAHITVVKKILQKIYDSGDIYFSEYEGLYCFGCERFYTEKELVDGKCPDHKTKPELLRESNYFFKMSRYQDWLIDHIKNNPDFITPKRYRNEVLSFLKEPLEDLCISRPKSRLEWGVTLPFDNKYVTYVWFDALVNYISAIGYPDGEPFKKFWPSVRHVVAKDILKPHGIYWPIMLKAAGIDIYQHLYVHGFWNIDESKMSKSLGNVVDPLSLKNIYGTDALRYFLMRDMVFGLDSNFSEDAMVERINSDLANDLGNLFSRVLTMAHKYFNGVIPDVDPHIQEKLQFGLQSNALSTVVEFEKEMTALAFHKGLRVTWEFISRMNKYIDVTEPWVLAKTKSTQKELEAVIYNLLEGLRIISGLIYPIMPETAETMQKHLGQKDIEPHSEKAFYDLELLRRWNTIRPGTKLPKRITLFPRIETKEKKATVKKETASESSVPEIKPEISMDEFAKVDLRVATVVHAETIPKAKKLLKLEVDLGEKRPIVAGISTHYPPEEMIGKQVIIVANLKPARLMGTLSKGMLLAAVDDNGCTVATLDKKVEPGTPLK